MNEWYSPENGCALLTKYTVLTSMMQTGSSVIKLTNLPCYSDDLKALLGPNCMSHS